MQIRKVYSKGKVTSYTISVYDGYNSKTRQAKWKQIGKIKRTDLLNGDAHAALEKALRELYYEPYVGDRDKINWRKYIADQDKLKEFLAKERKAYVDDMNDELLNDMAFNMDLTCMFHKEGKDVKDRQYLADMCAVYLHYMRKAGIDGKVPEHVLRETP